LVPRSPKAFRDAWHVLLHDLHLEKEMPPQEKYNAAQQIAYSAIVLMGIGSVMTGLAIYKPAQLAWLTALCGGYSVARLLHFLLTAGYVVFFLVHVVQVVLAGWNNFRSMVTGYELVNRRD
jgi:thiosulfate reductase cytochrome b subunit